MVMVRDGDWAGIGVPDRVLANERDCGERDMCRIDIVFYYAGCKMQ